MIMATQSTNNWNSPDYFRLLDEANNASESSSVSPLANQSVPYQIEVNISGSDDIKPSYETGSNFMLLLEDFGEYFYNYNGSGGNVGNNSSAGYDFQTNCSFSNSSCVELSGGKYILNAI